MIFLMSSSSFFSDKEIPSLVEKAERVVSKGYKTVAVATKEPFQLSKVSGLLENVNTEGNDEFLEQSETIFSKALRSTKGSVNRHPAPSVPDDPFEFEDKGNLLFYITVLARLNCIHSLVVEDFICML